MKFLFSQFSYLVENHKSRKNLIGFGKFLLLLFGVTVLFTVLFHAIMLAEGREFSWLTGAYWTLTVMSTLGFGDITFQSDLGRAFSILVLLTGIVMLLIVLPFAFIRYFYAPWLEAQIRTRAPRQLADGMRDHVVICRMCPIASGLTERLRLLGIPYVVLEPDATVAAEMHDQKIPVMTGDIESRATYEAARVQEARAVFANLTDEENSNVTLTVREVDADVRILATAERDESTAVLELAGATHALALKQRLGEQLANRVNARHCEAHVVGHFEDVTIAEFPVQRTPFEGKTVRETALRDRLGLNVVGVWQRGRLVPARPDTLLSATSVPVVVGTQAQLTALNQMVEAFDVNDHPVIVIGGGRVGRSVVEALSARGVASHVIESDPQVSARSEAIAKRVFAGEGANVELLKRAGIERAPSLVLTANDDATNIYLCILCRRLNPELRIVSRITHGRNVESIHRAGADFVLSYASLGQETVLALALERELIFVGEGVKFFSVKVPASLVGKTLRESEIGARTGMNVVALRRAADVTTNPTGTTVLQSDAELLAIGSSEQRWQFREIFE